MGRHREWGGGGAGGGGAQEVTRGRVHSKQADQREPGGDRHCGRETLPAPTGDTGVHFLWNASGIAGNRPTSNPPSSGLQTAGAPLLGSRTPSRKKKDKPRGVESVERREMLSNPSTLVDFINLIAGLI